MIPVSEINLSDVSYKILIVINLPQYNSHPCLNSLPMYVLLLHHLSKWMYLCKPLWISLWLWSNPGLPLRASLLLRQGRRDSYLLVLLPPAASCFGLQTGCSFFLTSAAFCLAALMHDATCCHWLGGVPHQVLSSSPCLGLSAEPSPNQKAMESSNSPPVVACWGWPVRARKSRKAWRGQGS